jgi:hypothetical protein
VEDLLRGGGEHVAGEHGDVAREPRDEAAAMTLLEVHVGAELREGLERLLDADPLPLAHDGAARRLPGQHGEEVREGVDVAHGRVARGGRVQPPVDPGLERIGGVGAFRPEHGFVEVAEIVHEDGLGHRLDAEPHHPVDLRRAVEAAMLDAVAPVRVGPRRQRGLEGVQGLLDRPVPDRMDGELVALGVVVRHEVVHLVVAQHHEPRGPGLAEIGLRHGGRAPARAAIGEDLHRAHPQHVAARARDHAFIEAALDDAARPAEEAEIGAHRQAAKALRLAIGDHLAIARLHAHTGVHDAGDAVGQARPAGVLDRRDELLARAFGDHGLQRIAGVLREEARETPVPDLDGAALGGFARLVDPGEPQGHGIGDGDVAAGAGDHDGIVRRRPVEFVAVGMAADVEGELVVAPCLDPGTGPRRLGSLAQQVEQALQGRRHLRPHVHLAHGDAVGQEMHVGVVEPRRREPPAQVHDAGRGASQRRDLRRRTRGEHAARPERHRLGHALGQAAEDPAVGEDEIGLGQRRHGNFPFAPSFRGAAVAGPRQHGTLVFRSARGARRFRPQTRLRKVGNPGLFDAHCAAPERAYIHRAAST